MNIKSEWKALVGIIGGFLLCFYLPIETSRFQNAVLESLHLVKWYAQEHVIFCLIPAFFIAGAISVFVSQASVMKYLGPKAKKATAYVVASVSGCILAVCSCTVLPLFSGIYRMGAGLGPAVSFLYSGPAINVLAIVMTTRILGVELGVARGIGAIVFSVVIGLLMQFIFRKEEQERAVAMALPEEEVKRPLWQNGLYFAAMVGILVFANFGKTESTTSIWGIIYHAKWLLTAGCGVALAIFLVLWFDVSKIKMGISVVIVTVLAFLFPETPFVSFGTGAVLLSILLSLDKDENEEWFEATWGFAKQILPLLLFGVLIAGLLLGRVGGEGLIPNEWINNAVGGNSLRANFFASFAGAFMYFATLTEVPILQGLINNGMGQGPALALLLAGPALSLPNMLVIRTVLGTKKTVVFVVLVIIMATISGLLFGAYTNL